MGFLDRLFRRNQPRKAPTKPTATLGLSQPLRSPPPSRAASPGSAPVESRTTSFNCPVCASACGVEPSPFSQYVNLYRCPQQHFLGVQCGSCHQGLMKHVEDLDTTVHTKCVSCGWQSSGISKEWWYHNVEKRQQTGKIPERPAAGSARSRQASPTTCAFCGKDLKVISDSPIGKLFNGIVCKSCGAVACMPCKGSSPSKPCSECGGSVAPAYADELMKAAARFSSAAVSSTASPAVPVPVPGTDSGPLFKPTSVPRSTSTDASPAGKDEVVLTTEQVALLKRPSGASSAGKDVIAAQPEQTWRAEYGSNAYREALEHEFITDNQRATVVKIRLQQKCDFKVRGVATCHECGAPISFEAKAYFGLGGGAGDPWCSSCKAQISVNCEQAGRDSDEVYLCVRPWTSRSGASVRSIAVEIRDITTWVRGDA
jgi:hypothetical protein